MTRPGGEVASPAPPAAESDLAQAFDPWWVEVVECVRAHPEDLDAVTASLRDLLVHLAAGSQQLPAEVSTDPSRCDGTIARARPTMLTYREELEAVAQPESAGNS